VKKAIMLAIGGLVLLTGCGSNSDKAAGIPTQPKWKGAPYRLAFDMKPGKPNPAGITIPGIKYTANPDALETRAVLVVRFDASGAKSNGPVMNRMIAAPFDIRGAEGALPADYMERASKELSGFLGAYCMKGKVNVSVALARSSLNPQAGDAEVEAKRMSDWLPIELVFKNPHPKC
jgi:hypothetical protein